MADKLKTDADLISMSVKELETYRNRIVKSANQKARRLKAWEQQYNETHDRPTKIASFAYASYVKQNQQLYGKDIGKEKRTGSTPKDVNALRHEIANARKFMSATSSSGAEYSKKGLKTVKTIKERYGLDIEVDDLYTFFESPQYDAWRKKYKFESGQAVVSIGNQLRDNDITLKQFLNQYFTPKGNVKKSVTNVTDTLPIEVLKKRKGK